MADYPLDANGTTYRKQINQKYPDLDIKHVHHAGNSSGIVDGAGAVLLGSKEAGEKHGLKPRAKIRAFADELAEAGYIAIAPDLITQKDGMTTADIVAGKVPGLTAGQANSRLDPDDITADLVELGFVTRPLRGNTLQISPPLTTTDDEVRTLIKAFDTALAAREATA